MRGPRADTTSRTLARGFAATGFALRRRKRHNVPMANAKEASTRRSVMKNLATGVGAAVVTAPKTAMPTLPSPAGTSPDGPDLLVTQFGARGDGATDDTVAFERAIAAAMQAGRRLRIPAGRYRITRTLTITRGIRVEGDGIERSVLLGAVIGGGPVLQFHAQATDSIMGPMLSGLWLDCAHGTGPCDGIRLSTGGQGAALHQAVVRDLFITNVAVGLALSGVVYRSMFDNITIAGIVAQYGVYCDKGFEDVTYNSFSNIEVTNVADGAHAFWIHSNHSNFSNLTSDGCSYFSSPGGTIRNLAVEGISARHPASATLLRFNQVQAAQGINLINIDPRRCACGIQVVGQAVVLQAIRCFGQQPLRLLELDPQSEGVIAGIQTERPAAMLEDYIPSETLRRWVVQAARSVTRRTSC